MRAIDGELASRRRSEVQAHLADCLACRERWQQILQAANAAGRAYRGSLESSLPPIAAARAGLESRLAAEGVNRRASLIQNLVAILQSPAWAYAAALIMVAAALVVLRYESSRWSSGNGLAESTYSGPLVPDASLTPGVVATVTALQVCTSDEPVEKRPSSSVARAVFREYGMDDARAQEYEVDHLITPALGGTDDIRNLWPESYSSEWNAHVKDDLEDRLHELVCQGKLDLGTAQREMATNWISAYKKYFHTDKPLLHNSIVLADRRNFPNG